MVKAKTLASFSMEGKVCVVTGAARGLGYEFCRAFIDAGCTSLAVVDLKDDEATAATEKLTAYAADSEDLKFVGIACDVASEKEVRGAFALIIETFGKIDAVVASAGIVHNYATFDYPTDLMKRLYDVNVHGCYFTAREAATHMVNQGGGSIILIASMSANIVNVPQLQTPYNASKAAVKHMAASLAVEWAKAGVRVNSLSPGYMFTPLVAEILEQSPQLKKFFEERTPMGRIGQPEDLAGTIVFMASDASKFMTGFDMIVDGGYSIV